MRDEHGTDLVTRAQRHRLLLLAHLPSSLPPPAAPPLSFLSLPSVPLAPVWRLCSDSVRQKVQLWPGFPCGSEASPGGAAPWLLSGKKEQMGWSVSVSKEDKRYVDSCEAADWAVGSTLPRAPPQPAPV